MGDNLNLVVCGSICYQSDQEVFQTFPLIRKFEHSTTFENKHILAYIVYYDLSGIKIIVEQLIIHSLDLIGNFLNSNYFWYTLEINHCYFIIFSSLFRKSFQIATLVIRTDPNLVRVISIRMKYLLIQTKFWIDRLRSRNR